MTQFPVSFGKENWFPVVVCIFFFSFKANMSKLILFFLLLNCNELQDASSCTEMRVTHAVCSGAFCEPEMMFDAKLFPFFSSSFFKIHLL